MREETLIPGSSIEERYRHALDRTAIVAITDRAGTITFVNDTFCAISGYEREELLGQNHRVLNSGHHPRSFFVDMFRAIASGRQWRGDVCNRAKDGSLYWVDTTIVPLHDASDTIDGYMSIRQDITKRKAREAQAEREARTQQAASEAKSAFVANMSHEIRTPLNAILGYTEVMSGVCDAGSEAAEHLETIRRNGEHLLSVINDVLDISKIEAGRMTFEPVDTLTVELFSEVLSLMQVRADAKGLPIELEFETDIPMTSRVDPVRLRQILINLIGNALKFTEVGGVRLIVGLEDDAESPVLRIEVADTGIGMSPEQCGRIFTPFEQADASTTRRFGGTGPGLAISRRLTELMGGCLSVTSVEGDGTSFIVRMPSGEPACSAERGRIRASEAWDEMVRRRAARERQAATASGTRSVLAGLRVLVAEDGPDNQRLINHFLKKAGIEPVIVGNGALAVGRIKADDAFDAILMDIQMPEMDGYQATRPIRGMGYARPIIALTAHAMNEERNAILAAGCDEFESKPINRERLFAKLAPWCDGAGSGGVTRRAA